MQSVRLLQYAPRMIKASQRRVAVALDDVEYKSKLG